MTRSRSAAASTALAATLGLLGCGSSSGGGAKTSATATATPSTVTAVAATGADTVAARTGTITASMRTTGDRPRVNRPWPVRFTVSDGGRPAGASLSYEFLFSGQVVAHRSHFRFLGTFADVVVWPPSSLGYPLTFRAVVLCSGRTLNLDFPVQVTR